MADPISNGTAALVDGNKVVFHTSHGVNSMLQFGVIKVVMRKGQPRYRFQQVYIPPNTADTYTLVPQWDKIVDTRPIYISRSKVEHRTVYMRDGSGYPGTLSWETFYEVFDPTKTYTYSYIEPP